MMPVSVSIIMHVRDRKCVVLMKIHINKMMQYYYIKWFISYTHGIQFYKQRNIYVAVLTQDFNTNLSMILYCLLGTGRVQAIYIPNNIDNNASNNQSP